MATKNTQDNLLLNALKKLFIELGIPIMGDLFTAQMMKNFINKLKEEKENESSDAKEGDGLKNSSAKKEEKGKEKKAEDAIKFGGLFSDKDEECYGILLAQLYNDPDMNVNEIATIPQYVNSLEDFTWKRKFRVWTGNMCGKIVKVRRKVVKEVKNSSTGIMEMKEVEELIEVDAGVLFMKMFAKASPEVKDQLVESAGIKKTLFDEIKQDFDKIEKVVGKDFKGLSEKVNAYTDKINVHNFKRPTLQSVTTSVDAPTKKTDEFSFFRSFLGLGRKKK